VSSCVRRKTVRKRRCNNYAVKGFLRPATQQPHKEYLALCGCYFLISLVQLFKILMHKTRLFTPGPTPIPEHVALAMAEPIIHHRNPEFIAIVRTVNEQLQYLFCTTQPVLTLTASGTGAAEATLASLFAAGEKGIVINNGKFAERWSAMALLYGINVVEIAVEWGQAPSEEQVRTCLQANPDASFVWFVHSETSTGVYTNIQAMSAIVRAESNALIIIDGVTSIGSHECRTDEWGLDVVFTGSQKGLMIPPGLAFITLSERAWVKAKTIAPRSHYFDVHQALKAYYDNSTPWTPAVSLIIGLEKALTMLRAEGIENVWARHALLSTALRNGIQALGMKLYGIEPSHAVTSVYLPNDTSNQGKAFLKILKEKFRITTAAGQDHVKDVIFRVSHLGYYDQADMLAVVSAIEQCLLLTGSAITPGAGVAAVQATFCRALTLAER
jgi:serine---pyruvate transaminase